MICKYPNVLCMYKVSKICENGKTKDACEFNDGRCLFDDSELYNEYLKTTSSVEKTCNHPEKYCYFRKENGTCGNKLFNCQNNDYITNTFTHVNSKLCDHQLYTCIYRQCGYCTYKDGKECILVYPVDNNSANYTINSIDDEVKKKYANTAVTVNDDIKYRICRLINKLEKSKKSLINPSNITIVDKIINDIKIEFPELYPDVMSKDKALDIIRHKEKYSGRELWDARKFILDEIANGADLVKPKIDIDEN